MLLKIKDILNEFILTVNSILRSLVFYKPVKSGVKFDKKSTAHILMNGPSLGELVEINKEKILEGDVFCSNFFGSTIFFELVKPNNYVILDPIFWDKTKSSLSKEVEDLFVNILGKTNWNMNLYLPNKFKGKGKWIGDLSENLNINVCYFNSTGLDGNQWVLNKMFSCQMGMPRPHNVLIPSIFLSIYHKYSKVYLYGCEHSGVSSLRVDDENEVFIEIPHFYDKEKKRLKAVMSDGRANPMIHDFLFSWATIFKSYTYLRKWADNYGVEIINCTPNSMIDAFKKEKI